MPNAAAPASSSNARKPRPADHRAASERVHRPTSAGSQPSFAHALRLRLPLLMLAILLTLPTTFMSGCDTAAQDIGELMETTPTPTEAAAWMFGPDPEQRRRGITLIANAPFGDAPPYVEVYRRALTDADPMVRAAAAHALGLNGDPADAILLANLLSDESEIVRFNAARGLQRLHRSETAVLNPLTNTMRNDPDPAVRRAAATALGQYAEPSVVESLIGALDDRSLAVNEAARRSLRFLTGQDFGLSPADWLNWWRSADAPFAEQRLFVYPVFRRDLTWIERLIPLFRPRFEFPGSPIGLEPPASAATASDVDADAESSP